MQNMFFGNQFTALTTLILNYCGKRPLKIKTDRNVNDSIRENVVSCTTCTCTYYSAFYLHWVWDHGADMICGKPNMTKLSGARRKVSVSLSTFSKKTLFLIEVHIEVRICKSVAMMFASENMRSDQPIPQTRRKKS